MEKSRTRGQLRSHSIKKTLMHAACELPPESHPLKGVRARGSASGETEEATIWRLLLSHLPSLPHAPAASAPIPLAGSAHLSDEWVRGGVNSGLRSDEAAENRGISGRKREEAGAGSVGFSPLPRIHQREVAAEAHLPCGEQEGKERNQKSVFFPAYLSIEK